MATAQTTRERAQVSDSRMHTPTKAPAHAPRNGQHKQPGRKLGRRSSKSERAAWACEGAERQHRVTARLRGFVERVDALLAARGMTYVQLALASGIDNAAFAHYRNYGLLPNARSLALIADALGCSADYLLGNDSAPGARPAAPTQPVAEGAPASGAELHREAVNG